MKNIALVTAAAALLLANVSLADSTSCGQNSSIAAAATPKPAPKDKVKPTLVVAKTPKTTTAEMITIKGSAKDNSKTVASVQYRVGMGAAKNATGTAKWNFSTPLVKGANVITITAIDGAGNKSANRIVKILRK